MKRQKLIGTIGGLMPFLILLLAAPVQRLDLPQAYKASVGAIHDNKGLNSALGGRIDYGPIPFFFWQESEGTGGAKEDSFYFVAKGPSASAMICVRLSRSRAARPAWQVAKGGYYMTQDGDRKPLITDEGPKGPEGPPRT